MHGLINRSIQLFLTETYGKRVWLKVVRAAGIEVVDFEGMMRYDDSYTFRLLDAATDELVRSRADLLEDIGTFIVSDTRFEAVRRLLRFGGIDFTEFLHSLDDLNDRVRLAVADLRLPKMSLLPHSDRRFSLLCDADPPDYGHLMVGVLRAMADDYGALVLLRHRGVARGQEVVSIRLVEKDFARGRTFELGVSVP